MYLNLNRIGKAVFQPIIFATAHQRSRIEVNLKAINTRDIPSYIDQRFKMIVLDGMTIETVEQVERIALHFSGYRSIFYLGNSVVFAGSGSGAVPIICENEHGSLDFFYNDQGYCGETTQVNSKAVVAYTKKHNPYHLVSSVYLYGLSDDYIYISGLYIRKDLIV